jgi:hypothetical protein
MNLEEAKSQAEKYSQTLNNLQLKGDPRSRVALACFAVAQQHFSAILILLDRPNPLNATAFALLRPLMEATLRGEWILHCASNDQVKTFAMGGKQQLDMSSLIKSLEKCNPGSDAHSVLYKNNWKIVSSYTHTYEHQVQHWLVDGDICPKYEPEQIAWLINAATASFRLSVSSIHSLAR